MSFMADPMIALTKLQLAVENSPPFDPRDLDEGYVKMYDEPNGGRRYSYAKIINGEVQAVSIFGLETPIGGVDCYNAGMTVANGTSAQIGFEELIADGTSDTRKAELRQVMLDYCRKDTIAMVNLVEWLRNAASAPGEIVGE